MELRTSETQLNDLRLLYESVRFRSAALGAELPSLTFQQNQLCSEFIEWTDGAQRGASANDVLLDFNEVKARMDVLKDIITKFEKRKTEKDPITQQPRYGQKTMTKVDTLIDLYYDLQTAVLKSTSEASNDLNQRGIMLPIDLLRKKAEEENNENELRELEARRARELEEQARKLEEQRRAEELRRTEELKRLEEERQRAETARLIEEARLARLREQEELERVERAWVDGIQKGPDGVREQLRILVESTKDDPLAQSSAVNALHTIFSQIVSRPEENNFRRIRRDHPKFMQGTCIGTAEVNICGQSILCYLLHLQILVAMQEVEKF
jgi:hypothetical protein